MQNTLFRLYSQATSPIAFLDESYELREGRPFYILACALVDPGYLNSTRKALTDYYDGEPMHASTMFNRLEFQSLRRGIELIATQHDGLDLVIQAPLGPNDPIGSIARKRCIEILAPMIHQEESTTLFVFDAVKPASQMKSDKFTFRDLRELGVLNRNVTEVHARPSDEPLLGLPDLLAWSYRQSVTKRDNSWFLPLSSGTRVHKLN